MAGWRLEGRMRRGGGVFIREQGSLGFIGLRLVSSRRLGAAAATEGVDEKNGCG